MKHVFSNTSSGTALCALNAPSVHTRWGGATLVDMVRGLPSHTKTSCNATLQQCIQDIPGVVFKAKLYTRKQNESNAHHLGGRLAGIPREHAALSDLVVYYLDVFCTYVMRVWASMRFPPPHALPLGSGPHHGKSPCTYIE